jgi:phage recombination protein Bet
MSNIIIRETREITVITQEKIQLVKDQIMKGASDAELELFVANSNRTGLDPFARQCWAIRRWDASLGREVYTFQTSVDGFRVIANRSGSYAGQVGPFWCGPDGEWKDVWLSDIPPMAAKIGVLRTEFKEPLWAVAKFSSYVARKKDGSLTPFWFKMPEVMIAKVAECLAIRKAFPQDLSGIYAKEEMEAADAERDITPKGGKPDDPSEGYKLAGPSPRDYERMNKIKEEISMGSPAAETNNNIVATITTEPETPPLPKIKSEVQEPVVSKGPIATPALSEPQVMRDLSAGEFKIPAQCFKIQKFGQVKNIPEKEAKAYVATVTKYATDHNKPLNDDVLNTIAAIESFWGMV